MNKEKLNKTIRYNFNRLMRTRGYGPTALANKMGMPSKSYISMIQRGTRNLTEVNVPKFAEALEVPAEEFFKAIPKGVDEDGIIHETDNNCKCEELRERIRELEELVVSYQMELIQLQKEKIQWLENLSEEDDSQFINRAG
jgi:transcriptional regulator with XRE-family HTH domain